MQSGQSYFLASLPILHRRFYTPSRPFVRILTVARVRTKYDCVAVQTPEYLIGNLSNDDGDAKDDA